MTTSDCDRAFKNATWTGPRQSEHTVRILHVRTLSHFVAQAQNEIQLFERMKLSDRAFASTMNLLLVACGEAGVPCDELDVVDAQPSGELGRVNTGMEPSPGDAIVDVWTRGCDFVMSHFDPWSMQRFKYVNSHVANKLRNVLPHEY